ncbi:ABC1 family domain containing protein [Musa troglodytarum]|uniref:ABC1 family domain containing protein n=1 Tax=Musa troglodytarum TaxID=320322 RepID=A0A9E7L6H7_9LILI|nr:ABC1 family domain containing protein [Musa troglodytarum]
MARFGTGKHTPGKYVFLLSCVILLALVLLADFLWASSSSSSSSRSLPYRVLRSPSSSSFHYWSPYLDLSMALSAPNAKQVSSMPISSRWFLEDLVRMQLSGTLHRQGQSAELDYDLVVLDSVWEARFSNLPEGNSKGIKLSVKVLNATFADIPAPQLEWEEMPEAPVPRLDGAAIQIKDLFYVFAGYGTIDYVHSHVDIYNFKNNSWGGRFDMPREMANSHLGMATDGRYIYAVTGQYGPQCRSPTNRNFVLDTETKKWNELPPLPVPRYAPATQLWRGRLHVMGGSKEDRHEPGLDHWSLAVKDGMALEKEWTTEIPIPRGGPHRSCVVVNDQLIVIGGQEGDFMAKPGSPIYKCSRRHEVQYGDVYMLKDGKTWKQLPSMPLPNSHIEFAWVVVNNSIIVVGGTTLKHPVTKKMILLGEVFRFNLDTLKWSVIGRMPFRVKTTLAAFWNGWLYFTSGQRDAGPDDPSPRKVVGSLLFPQNKVFHGWNNLFMLYKTEENISKNNPLGKFSVLSARSLMTHRIQVAWKQLCVMYSYRGIASSPVSKIACAASLAVVRSHLVPSFLAFITGEIALSKTAWADGEYFPTRNALYMQAQDSHIFLTSFILSILEYFISFLRAFYLAVLFSPIIVLAPLADSCDTQFRKMWIHLVHSTLEKAGPAFIKWGQWAATRPDLFPSDLCSELAKLHSKAPAHSFAYTRKSIERAFGHKLSDVFENFEEEPVASGSVAQVHRASLRFRHPGQHAKQLVVAVKVRHPGVGESIKRDFMIINLVAKISKFMPTLKWLRLDESVQQFAVFMMSQVDLAREAAHLSRFIYNFRRWKDVSFPKPLYPLVHPAVLVETYEHGQSVSYYVDELEGHDRLKSALAHIGTHALLKMLLVDNFVHADLHPGNMLVRAQTKHSNKRLFKSKPHVIFLDVGMTAELSSSDRVNLLNFFKAVALRDGRTAAECTLRLSRNQNCSNPKAFIEEVDKSFSFWGSPEGDSVHPAECMHQLLEQVRRHKVNIDGNVCTVMVTTLVLEGWQRKLDPDYDIMQTLRTLLFKSEWAQSLSYTIEALMSP